jgi:tetratricopeptide (TPR) repeat protein
MRTQSLTFLITSLIISSAALAQAPKPEPIDGFLETYSAAQAEAKKLDKPIYLHFTTDWCGWCRKIENDIYRTPAGKEALKPFVPVSLDCTKPTPKINHELMRKFGGGGYPFLAVVAPDGTLLHSWSGYAPMPQFKKQLAQAMKNFKAYQAFQSETANADKQTIAYNLKALKMYGKLGDWNQAAAAADKLAELDPTHKQSDAAQIAFVRFRGAVAQRDQAKAMQLEKQVVELDPDNAKGYREQVTWGRAMASLQKARTAKSKAAQAAALKDIVSTLDAFVAQAKTIQKPADIYSLQGFAHMQLGQFDQAITAFEKLKQHVSADKMQALEEQIEKLKQARDSQAPASQADKG